MRGAAAKADRIPPFVTVVMPVKNEERFIAQTLGAVLAQDYPAERFEVLVADGGSTDSTRAVVAEFMDRHPNVRLADNAKGRSSAGRNVGFTQGRGELFVVVDGHCHIPSRNLLRDTARLFEQKEVHCLGRPQRLTPPGLTAFQEAVALARSSVLGHGTDSLIYSDHEGYASPVSNGASYRREVFEQIGLVDESFDACEDVEFNLRVEQAGFRSYTSPALAVHYYPRESLAALARQMARYGAGRCRLWRKHPGKLGAGMPAILGLTALVPLAPAGVAAGALSPLPLWAGLLPAAALAAYAVSIAACSAVLAFGSRWRHLRHLPLIFPVIHFGLGFGFLRELAEGRFRGGVRAQARLAQAKGEDK